MKAAKRTRRVAVACALAVSAVATALPSSAEAAGSDEACRNNVTANNSQIFVDTQGNSTASVAPGATITLTNLAQNGSVPGTIFVAGYNLGLLSEGENNIPSDILTDIEGTNTVEGVKTTSTESTVVTTTIDDPDNAPGTGDETATPATFNVAYDDMTFTAGASPGTAEFRQDTQDPIAASPEFAESGSLIIRSLVGGFFKVRFACSPGTVSGPDPGTVTPIDPALLFASTEIQEPAPSCFGVSGDDLTPISNPGGTAYVSSGVAVSGLNDTFTGTAGDDVIIGSAWDEVINGNGGDDAICSRGGGDRVHGNKGFDDIDTGEDNDRAWGDNGWDDLYGGDGNDKLVGELGLDSIVGGNGDDNLIGGANDDTLLGEAGNDTMDGDNAAPYGPAGTDACDGGADTDGAIRCESTPNVP